MAIVNLGETLKSYILRRNQLNLEISELQSKKSLATYSQADVQSLQSAETRSIRRKYKEEYDADAALQEKYKNYTEMPDFEDEIDKITAKFQDQLDELSAWEVSIDAQITTNSTELEEVKAYIDSNKSMLSSNIQEDFNFGLNG